MDNLFIEFFRVNTFPILSGIIIGFMLGTLYSEIRWKIKKAKKIVKIMSAKEIYKNVPKI